MPTLKSPEKIDMATAEASCEVTRMISACAATLKAEAQPLQTAQVT